MEHWSGRELHEFLAHAVRAADFLALSTYKLPISGMSKWN